MEHANRTPETNGAPAGTPEEGKKAPEEALAAVARDAASFLPNSYCMLRLAIPQIVAMWVYLRPAIAASLPPLAYPADDEEMEHVKENLLAGRMQCWLGVRYGATAQEVVVYAVAVTQIQHESGTDENNLWIYSLFSWRGVPPALARVGFEALKRYAKECGCRGLAAVTNVPQAVALVQKLGGDASYTLVRLEV